MKAEIIQFPGQVATSVDLSYVCPGTPVDVLVKQSLMIKDPYKKKSLEREAQRFFEKERQQLDSAIELMLRNHYPELRLNTGEDDGYFTIEKAYDKNGTVRESSVKYVMNDPTLPFESLIADMKTFAGLVEKVRIKSEDLRKGKIKSYSVEDLLRVRFLVDNTDVQTLDKIQRNLQQTGELANSLGISFVPGELENYHVNPKPSGYGKYGVMHQTFYIANPGSEPLRAIEVQMMTQEQAFQEMRDGYHRDQKKELQQAA
ncbi:MAG: hypothetical protein KKH52_04835 [Nanoarchaeota archaeon]|nr:hypothetical protein [Nanoarchaeota archaeon]MBU1623305.1 hypothetical protein [Nanoarchaeota archaeon]MBU1974692.1 hypothetical protein [Nanoarchaeota archaeon]